jgi:hypothetical protein
MKTDHLVNVLTDRLGADVEEDEYILPQDREVTALLKTGADLLHINRVRVIEIQDDSITVVTKDSEYFVDRSDLFAVKLEGSRLNQGDSRPGFRRD